MHLVRPHHCVQGKRGSALLLLAVVLLPQVRQQRRELQVGHLCKAVVWV